MRSHVSIVIDEHDRPIVRRTDDDPQHELDGDVDEPWVTVDIAQTFAMLGPQDQMERLLSEALAMVRLA